MAVRWVEEEDGWWSDGGILVQSGRKLLLLLGRSVAGWAERFRRLAGIDRSSRLELPLFMRAQQLPLFDGYLDLLIFTEYNRLRQTSLREEAIMLQPLKISER